MRYRDRSSGLLSRLPVRQTALLSIVLTLACLSTFAYGPPVAFKTDEVKKLIKEATKLSRAGLNDKAEVILRRAVDLDKNRTDSKVELAYVLVKRRRLLEAYELSFGVANAERSNTRALAVLGATLLSAGRFHEARAIFYKAITLNQDEHLAWAGYGMHDYYENNIDNSIANLQQAVYRGPEEPDYVFSLAQVAARSERYKEAAENYRKFLTISKSTDVERRERIKGLISFLEFLGNVSGLYVNFGQDQTTVPFELVGNRPVIHVKINKYGDDLRFVLDTGSGISVVSEETAKRLKVKAVARGGLARGIGGDGKFEIVYGQIKELNIGEVGLKNVPVYIRKFHNSGTQIDGYIGLALISKFLTTIDYGAQTFSLTKRENDRREFLAKGDMSLPLRLTSSGFLSGEVQLEGIEAPLNFIVDTGASVSVISQGISRSDRISPHVNDEKIRVIGSAGVTDDVATYLLPRVTFGKNTMESVKAIALDLDLINEASGFEQSGILGGNFLMNYRLTFDFRNSKVTFVSIGSEKE